MLQPKSNGRNLARLSALTLLAFSGASGCATWRPLPSPIIEDPDPGRFEKNILAESLDQPMELEILPDGRILFIEIAGEIKIYHPKNGKVTVAGEIDVFTEMENGLLGLALDPTFRRTGWLYLYYSPAGDAPTQHLSRFKLRGNRLDLDSEVVLLVVPTQRDECCHHAGSIEFGPGGNLFISAGDNTNPFDSNGFSPSDYRTGRSAWDAAKSSANTNDLRGKILRIHPERDGTYTIPEGNLFPPGDPKGAPEIYVMGCRNPWRISVDPATGFLYWGDVGPDSRTTSERGPRGYDEINQARAAGNFGWPFLIADNKPYAAYDFDAETLGEKFDPLAPTNLSPNNTGYTTLPPAQSAFIWYPYVASAEFPAVGKGGRTACAGPIYHYDFDRRSADQLPARFDNCLFIYDWERNWLKAVKLDANSNIVWIEDFMGDHEFLRPVDMQFGPGGDLYLFEYGTTWDANADSKLVRLRYRVGNREPRVIASATPSAGKEPLTVQFTSAGTLDPDGDAVGLRWNFRSRFGRSSDENPTFTYRRPGVYKARLRAVDAFGARADREVEIVVGNAPPKVRFDRPADGSFFDWDKSIDYSINVVDEEDGDLAIQDELHAAVFLNATYHRGRLEVGPEGDWQETTDAPGLALMKRSNCFNCHAVEKRVVGPSFTEISERYSDDGPAAVDVLVRRVTTGSTGVWDDEMAMLPHEENTPDEVEAMVKWVLAAKDLGEMTVTRGGVEGQFAVPERPAGRDRGVYLLTAAYTDQGAPGLPSLSGRAQVLLRSRRLRAEHFTAQSGVELADPDVSADRGAIRSIHDGDYVAFETIHLDEVGALSYRVAPTERAGIIEVRLDSADGATISRAEIPAKNDEDDWTTIEADLKATQGVRDLFFVFKQTDARGLGSEPLFKLKWIEFHPPKAKPSIADARLPDNAQQ